MGNPGQHRINGPNEHASIACQNIYIYIQRLVLNDTETTQAQMHIALFAQFLGITKKFSCSLCVPSNTLV